MVAVSLLSHDESVGCNDCAVCNCDGVHGFHNLVLNILGAVAGAGGGDSEAENNCDTKKNLLHCFLFFNVIGP